MSDHSSWNHSQQSQLKREKLPCHVAIIMDGNGRWAQKQHKPRVFGHRHGVNTVREIIKFSDELGIKVLSLFAFSEENWGRPEYEVSVLMTLLNSFIISERDELDRKNVQFRFMGRRDRLSEKTKKLIRETESMLGDNTGLVLNVALSYSGRAELVDAFQDIAAKIASKDLVPKDINFDVIENSLQTVGLPEPDLLIRTSGEKRISNFMLWQLAYTELYFTDVLWPDFDRQEYTKALLEYQDRQRRFGLVKNSSESSVTASKGI